MINVMKVSGDAILPTRGTPLSAGLDLYSTQTVTISPRTRQLIHTGIAVELPIATVGLIWPRSKLAYKHGIDVMAGVIDCDYRGEVGVVLINHGNIEYTVQQGDKIAQMILQAYLPYDVRQVYKMEDTERNEQGINSTEERR